LEIASMTDDPDGTYGAWLAGLGLSEAIEREILAGFEIDVLGIRDPSPALGLSEEALRGRRLALLQTALLEHAARHNLKTMMTFRTPPRWTGQSGGSPAPAASARMPTGLLMTVVDFRATPQGLPVLGAPR
jgi:hypothetical protein